MLRWDELTHSSQALYRFRQRVVMRPFHTFAKRTRLFDAEQFGQFASGLESMWTRTLAAQRVLEVGCGLGNFSKAVLRKYGGRDYCGVDAAHGLLRDTRPGYQRVKFVTARVERLPFADGAWDVVLCRYLMHHVQPEQREHALRELRRIASNAVVIQDVYGFSGGLMRRPYEAYYRVADGSYYRPTRAEWLDLFGRSGLRVREMKDCGEGALVYRAAYWVLTPEGRP